MSTAKTIDLFCGAGGLTFGLQSAGLNVVEGIDLDEHCRYPYEKNTNARFIVKDKRDYDAQDLEHSWSNAELRVLVGCAPCQKFSTYSRGNSVPGKYASRWGLIRRFMDLAEQTRPEVVSMENVPPLGQTQVFRSLIQRLQAIGYSVDVCIADCRTYGAPQTRRRLVLLASRLGPISLVPPSHPNPKAWVDVHSVISQLRPIRAGEVDTDDPLHRASRLSALNTERIKASKPGGTWRDWPDRLVAPCHKRFSGKTYPSVYGRMEWYRPGPTITGQCFGYGNGRFGHPEQDRAMSLREAALLQTFPQSFEFFPPDKPFPGMDKIGRMIGNAVPPVLGRVIGKSIIKNLESYAH